MGKDPPDRDNPDKDNPDESTIFAEELKKEILKFMESETEKLRETIDHLTNENASQKKVIANPIQRIEKLEKPRPYSEVIGASGSNQTTSNTIARPTATPEK